MKLCTAWIAGVLVVLAIGVSTSRAADVYWDINGATAGTTDAADLTADGAATGTFWSSDPNGLAATVAWVVGDRAIFSAGTNATGSLATTGQVTNITGNLGTVTPAPRAPAVGGILVEEGEVAIDGQFVMNPGAIVEVNAGAILSQSSSVRVDAVVSSATVATVQYKLNGPTAVIKSTNTGFAGSFIDGDAQIVLNGGGKFVYDGGAEINIIAAQTGVNAAAIIGTGPLIVDATVGALAIAGAATYTGGTEIIGGELRIRTSNDRLPIATAVTVTSPGVLNLNGLNQQIGSLTGNGNVGTAAGTLTINGSASTVFDGALVNTANFNTPPAPASTGTFGRLIKSGSGTITFNGVNDINGSVTLNAGGITVGASGSLCGDLADLTITGGTLTLNNAAETVENFGGTGGSVVLNGTALTTDPTTNATTANTTYAGPISGTGSLIKNNTIAGIAKTLSLSGLNTYGGGTTINGGRVNSNSATGTGSGAVQVNTDGTLGGSGGVSGAITVAGGARLTGGLGLGNGQSLTANSTVNIQAGGQIELMIGSIRPGDFNNNGVVDGADYVTWRNAGPTDVLPNDDTSGVVDASDYTDFRGNFGGTALVGQSDKLNITAANALTLDAGSIVTVSGGANAPQPGTYTLLQYNTGYTGSLASTILNNASGFEIGAVGNADDVVTDNTAADTFEVAITGTVQNRTWVPGGTGNWSANSADNANWTPVGQPNGPGAIGNFAGSGAQTVTITDTDKTLGVMNFDNTSGYTIASAGTQRLITNAYGGSNAQINVLNGSHTISAPMYVSKATTATISNAADTLSISGNIGLLGVGLTKAGPGSMDVSGFITATGSVTVSSGTLTLSGQNSYNGGTTIAAGATLVAANTVALTSATGLTGTNTVNGILNVNAGARTSNPTTINSGGVESNSGTTTGTHTVVTGGIENILSGATASGTHTVTGGTVNVTGTLTGAATVNTGGALTGTGNVGSMTFNNTGGSGGRLQPGTNGTIGALIESTTTGIVTFGNGSIFDIDIMAPGTQGVDYDTLYIQSTVATTGGLVVTNPTAGVGGTIAIHDLSGVAGSLVGSYIIIDYATTSNVNQANWNAFTYTGPGAYTFSVTKDTGANNIVLNIAAAGSGSGLEGGGTVPEPASIGLVAIALLAFAGGRRSRKA